MGYEQMEIINTFINGLVGIGTLALAFAAFKQLRELKEERKRKIALELAALSYYILGYIIRNYSEVMEYIHHYRSTDFILENILSTEYYFIYGNETPALFYIKELTKILKDKEILRIGNEIYPESPNKFKLAMKLLKLINILMKKYKIGIEELKRHIKMITATTI